MNRASLAILCGLLLCISAVAQAVTPNVPTGSLPQVLRFVAPAYPRMANDARMMGTVVTRIKVGKDGRVLQADLVSGHPFFTATVLDALKQWRFTASQEEYTFDVACRFEFYGPDKCLRADGKPITPETLVSAELPTDVLVRTTGWCDIITNYDPVVR
jgi:TonB family protein